MSKIEKITRLTSQGIDMLKYNRMAKKYKDDPKYRDMWLISERGVEAKDNGYVFFRYLRENHPEINAWYVIDTSHKKDYDKVKDLGNIIEYMSDEHKIAFILCKYAISTHVGFLEPWSYRLYKKVLDRSDEKYFIFLQHGVIFNDVSNAVNHKNHLDLFITTTKKEYESICGENYGFRKGVVVQTGIARYDNLNSFRTKDQILLMPTWRDNIITPSYKKQDRRNEELFRDSDYFKSLNSFINNERLIEMLDQKNMKLVFYPHYEMQPYNDLFDIKSDRIVVASKEEYDVQTLLKESKLMITDYSSVQFDFAYMEKPIIFYQNVPDEKYNKGYMNYEEDGFGEVCMTEKELLDVLETYFENGFKMKDKYIKRAEESFSFRDDKNSQRIYEAICNLKK